MGPRLLRNVLDTTRCADVGQTELAVDKVAITTVDHEVLLERCTECEEGARYEGSDKLDAGFALDEGNRDREVVMHGENGTVKGFGHCFFADAVAKESVRLSKVGLDYYSLGDDGILLDMGQYFWSFCKLLMDSISFL